MSSFTSTCLWRITPSLLIALQQQLGDPLDTYVNGAQVWLREDGPSGETIEWRLHPVANYERPANVETAEVFLTTTFALMNNEAAIDPSSLWDGLEAFAAYEDEIEPIMLAKAAQDTLGVPADYFGIVDHASIGAAWERSQGAISIVESLVEQLTSRQR